MRLAAALPSERRRARRPPQLPPLMPAMCRVVLSSSRSISARICPSVAEYDRTPPPLNVACARAWMGVWSGPEGGRAAHGRRRPPGDVRQRHLGESVQGGIGPHPNGPGLAG